MVNRNSDNIICLCMPGCKPWCLMADPQQTFKAFCLQSNSSALSSLFCLARETSWSLFAMGRWSGPFWETFLRWQGYEFRGEGVVAGGCWGLHLLGRKHCREDFLLCRRVRQRWGLLLKGSKLQLKVPHLTDYLSCYLLRMLMLRGFLLFLSLKTNSDFESIYGQKSKISTSSCASILENGKSPQSARNEQQQLGGTVRTSPTFSDKLSPVATPKGNKTVIHFIHTCKWLIPFLTTSGLSSLGVIYSAVPDIYRYT